jgi:membrane-associated HD superfamily phosphohydrolase
MGGGGSEREEAREEAQKQRRQISQKQLELERQRLEQQKQATQAFNKRISLLEEQRKSQQEAQEKRLALLGEQQKASRQQFIDFSNSLDDITKLQRQQLGFLRDETERQEANQRQQEIRARDARLQNNVQRDLLTDDRNRRIANEQEDRQNRSSSLRRASLLGQNQNILGEPTTARQKRSKRVKAVETDLLRPGRNI